MNKQIRRLAVGLLACYLVLFVQLNVLAVGRQRELNADPRNNRQTERDFNRPRGSILAADGTVLARSVPLTRGAKFKYQREYPTGDLFGNVTGYYTFNFGSTQIERTQNDVLMGDTSEQKIHAISGLFSGTDNTGSVVLTMRPDVQRVAADALGDARGLRGGDGSAHRRGDRDDQQSALRPGRRRGARRQEGRRRADVPQRPARQAVARQCIPRAVHARLELQGHHDVDRLRERGDLARPGLPASRGVRTATDH